MVDPGPMVEILNEYHKAGTDRGFWWFQLDPSENCRSECNMPRNMDSFLLLCPVRTSDSAIRLDDPWGGGPGCVTISGPANEEARAWYRDNHIPVLAYSSLGRGMFAGIVKSDDIEGAKKILDPICSERLLLSGEL